ncbi:hypothetical protein [Natrinema pallidum]|uniref:Uncharacterized protein n=1 Tax=Natrinema pallidum TaxID=69527 RepID=A0A4P9TK16_9EURY|nr:hypothetical protein [Natrinema pallidum]QCW05273.1 hypothetical protein FGF80_18695 [Natrinema pallidum]
MTETAQTRLDGGVKTLVGHCRDDETDIYVGRGDRGDAHLNNTEIGKRGWLGNPYPKDDYGRAECIELFRADFEDRLEADGPACHGEVIAEHADRLAAEGSHE